MKKVLVFILSSLMVFNLVACNSTTTAPEPNETNKPSNDSAYDKVNLKISYATSDAGMDGIAAIKFEELVEERSGGLVQIDRYPNCQLSGGDMVRHVEMMISGGAFELAIISTSSFSDVNQQFQVTSIPFAFADYDTAYKYLDSTGGEWEKNAFAKIGVVKLDGFSNGIMQIANNKNEVRSPKDLKNLKMRTYGDLQMSLMRDFGADPTNLSWSELYSALQTGAVNGNMNGYQTLWSGSLHEVQPYITEVNVVWSQYAFLANQASWDKLNSATQLLIQECATEASLYAREHIKSAEEQIKEDMINFGVSIYVPTAEEMAEFKKAASNTINKYKEICGEEACKAWGID
jgi:tripartite ATP-independent transporter DctP family solute receptor